MGKKYDFSGWATRANVRCSDGRVIMDDAFKDCDGKTVPLVWNHQHDDPFRVLGHALLRNIKGGVRAYCSFNESEPGEMAKVLVKHGDVRSLSILANQLQQNGNEVHHGIIREVSLVLAGANPRAYIDDVVAHSDESNPCYPVFHFEDGEISLEHGDILGDENPEQECQIEHVDKSKEGATMATEPETKKPDDGEETVADVFNTLTEKQKMAVYAIADAIAGGGDDSDDEGGNDDMKHNLFDQDPATTEAGVLCHADQEEILEMAKKQTGSFQSALKAYAESNGMELKHDGVGGFVETGEGNIYNLFPDYKEVRPGAPELITNDQGWIDVVMRKVHKSPISRIRTSQVDIRNADQLRAKGYRKGKAKTVTGNFNLLRRTTDPQTVYVKDAIHRDDIIDITDFDYVQYLYNIDRMMLNEELAMAIMLGDGRDLGDENKIHPDHIRPIWTDDDLFTLHTDLDLEAAKKELQGTNTGANFGENYIMAEAMINTVLYARENYRGTGTPDMFITPHMLNVMLLARDLNGRRIYDTKAELASALNVGNIYTAEQFEGKTREASGSKTKKLLAMIVNLNDYSLGATKGGEVTHFTQFDIDFNQQKSLLETRCSGALTRVYSAIAIEEDITE